MKKQKIIGSLLAGIIVFGCLSACTSAARYVKAGKIVAQQISR